MLETLNVGWRQRAAPSLLSRNQSLAIVAKNYAKADIKDFWCCPLLHYLFTMFQIFYPELSLSTNFCP